MKLIGPFKFTKALKGFTTFLDLFEEDEMLLTNVIILKYSRKYNRILKMKNTCWRVSAKKKEETFVAFFFPKEDLQN